MHADTERAIAEAAQCCADACLEHDAEHMARAWEVYQRLVPQQRQDDE